MALPPPPVWEFYCGNKSTRRVVSIRVSSYQLAHTQWANQATLLVSTAAATVSRGGIQLILHSLNSTDDGDELRIIFCGIELLCKACGIRESSQFQVLLEYIFWAYLESEAQRDSPKLVSCLLIAFDLQSWLSWVFLSLEANQIKLIPNIIIGIFLFLPRNSIHDVIYRTRLNSPLTVVVFARPLHGIT